MKKHRLILYTTIFLTACNSANNKNKSAIHSDSVVAHNETKNAPVDTIANTNSFDTTLYLFADKKKGIQLRILNTNEEDVDKNNAVLNIINNNAVPGDTIFVDSLHCKSGVIDLSIRVEDFNGDKTNDLLLFFDAGARANLYYHLYLVKDTTVHRVKGFEELPNPEFDSVNNIINTVGLSGENYLGFYRISRKNTLVNLGHDDVSGPDDSIKYEKMLKALKQQNR